MLGLWPNASHMFVIYLGSFLLCLEISLLQVEATNDIPNMAGGKVISENPQLDIDYSKADLPMWDKRGWNNLHSSWGKRESDSNFDAEAYPMPIALIQKQQGWRKLPLANTEDDEYLRQLVVIPEEDAVENSNRDYYPDQEWDFGSHDVNKRNWRSFSDGWGKRSKWDKFRGSWGKRQPAWNNLKGLWGKRSLSE